MTPTDGQVQNCCGFSGARPLPDVSLRQGGHELISPRHIIPCLFDPGEFCFFKAPLRESLSLFFKPLGLFADLACGAPKFL
jgi:hypothetical protein